MHDRLRSTADRAARWLGILARRERTLERGLTVLMYHRVLPDERCTDYPLPSLAMPVSAFRAQVRWLAARAEVLPLSAALESPPSPRSRRRFAITLDDGYEDSARCAAPVLEEAGVRGTFYVTTGFVGTRDLLWFDAAVQLFERVAEPRRREVLHGHASARALGGSPADGRVSSWIGLLKRCSAVDRRAILAELTAAAGGPLPADGYEAMSVSDVTALHARGHEIGSHTVTHALLPQLDDEALQSETHGARETLRGWLGCDVPGFCYPNGDFDERVASAVARAGHRHACTTMDGIHAAQDDPFRIRRVDVVPARVLDRRRRFDETAFRRELCGLYRRRAS
ncbi:MAG TPA: polysaccharide deacetylase family protein [Planctomycetota bacterium]|nr:polysaccharide deacetylase family protein [Planctomycetota bacterium]